MGNLRVTFETTTPSAVEGESIVYPDSAGNLHAISKVSGTTTNYTLNGNNLNNTVNGRLTLTSGTPVLTTDVIGATTLYFTPYKGNKIALYDLTTTSWIVYNFTELSLSLSAYTASTPYDIFIYNNNGTLTLSSTAWTNTTTRATALIYQDGVYVKTGAINYRYIGTIYINSSGGQTDMRFGLTAAAGGSNPRCYVWNNYNRVAGAFGCFDSTSSWTYTTAAWRQRNGSSGNKFESVVGLITEGVSGISLTKANNTNSGTVVIYSGSNLNTTSSVLEGHGSMVAQGTVSSSIYATLVYSFSLYLPIGYNYIADLEYSTATGTTSWYSNGSSGVTYTFWY